MDTVNLDSEGCQGQKWEGYVVRNWRLGSLCLAVARKLNETVSCQRAAGHLVSD